MIVFNILISISRDITKIFLFEFLVGTGLTGKYAPRPFKSTLIQMEYMPRFLADRCHLYLETPSFIRIYDIEGSIDKVSKIVKSIHYS